MKLQRSVEKTLAKIVIGGVKVQMLIPRLFVALGSSLRAGVFPKGGKRGDPSDGLQGAGVPARLKPPPPVLSAAAAKVLPQFDEREAA